MKHTDIYDGLFKAATCASMLIGAIEGMRNVEWHSGNYRQALYLTDILIRNLESNSFSQSCDRWLDQYKLDQIQLKSQINETVSA